MSNGMFDLDDPQSTRLIRNPDDTFAQGDPSLDGEPPAHPLDSPENTELFHRILGFYRQELTRQEGNRAEQAMDEDFYDHIQYTEEDIATLRARGQSPIVYNVIAQSINWIIGSEKRGRTDFKVLPRRKAEAKPAERKTQLLKYLSDQNNLVFHRSRAFEDAVKVGIGWLEDGVQDSDDTEPVYSRYENWRNMIWDSAGTEMDGGDWRYVFRSRWVDTDVGVAHFPDREGIIDAAAINSARFGGTHEVDGDEVMDTPEYERENNGSYPGEGDARRRQRVRLIEGWFRVPTKVQKIVGGVRTGDVYDPTDPVHAEELGSGAATLAERTMMRMYVAIFTTDGLLYLGPTPYRHNGFPFTPIWGYRRGRDGMPYGVIRGMRSIQEDINKRASKALAILSSNKIIMDKGAVDDVDELAEEVARPDAIIIKNFGKELTLNAERDLAPAHLDLMSRNIEMLQSVSGVTDELLGRTTNASSGVAVQARQNQGQLSTSKLFDNLRFGVKIQGEKQLSLIEQFFTEAKEFRITNTRGTPEYIAVNDGLPENDIAHSRADFVVGEADWRITMRQAASEQFTEMLTRMPPEVAIVLLDMAVETMDIPNVDEVVRRIRAINGQRDPDATEPTPEDIAKAQAQQAQQQKEDLLFQLNVRKLAAEAGKSEAQVQQIAAQAQQIASMLANTNVDTEAKAIAAAQAALIPGVAEVADALLFEAGYVPPPVTQAREQLSNLIQGEIVKEAQRRQAAAGGMPPQPGQQPPPQQQPQAAPQQPPAAPVQ